MGHDSLVEHLRTQFVTAINRQVPKQPISSSNTRALTLYPYRKAPEASTTTSSTLSDNRSIKAPTTFLAWNNRRVAGSFWTKLQMAAHAHVLSAYSAEDS